MIGPVLVTVASSDGDDETVDADALRFVGRYVTIDSTTDGMRHLATIPASRLVRIVARE